MTDRIHVTVTVDTDDLREWADRHADMGNHGVAHVLYQAARDGESLGEQAIREAEKRGAVEALRMAATDPSLRLSGHGGVSITRLRDRADRLADGSES